MRRTPSAHTGEALTGAIISAAFAVAWSMWGASGLSSAAAAVIRIVALLAGLALIGRAIALRRAVPPTARDGTMFASTEYRVIVAVELVALFGGGAVLGATAQSAYTITWFALIVGAHFLAFGRAFWAGFYLVGAVLIGGAIAGALIGLAGESAAGIRAVTGLTAATGLSAASGWTVLYHDRM